MITIFSLPLPKKAKHQTYAVRSKYVVFALHESDILGALSSGRKKKIFQLSSPPLQNKNEIQQSNSTQSKQKVAWAAEYDERGVYLPASTFCSAHQRDLGLDVLEDRAIVDVMVGIAALTDFKGTIPSTADG